MEDKHYPVIDRETDILGLEPFDLIVVITVPMFIGFLLLVFLPVPQFFKVLIAVGTVISIGIMFVKVRKMKHGKNKGYIYRRFQKLLRNYKKIY